MSSIYHIVIKSKIAILLFATNCFAQTSLKNEYIENAPDQARIEVYSETKTAANSKFVSKCVYNLDQNALQEVLNLELKFLPYYKEEKKNITLQEYFSSIEKRDMIKHRALFPKDLYAFMNISATDKSQFQTLLNEKYNKEIITIFINDFTWYTEDIYYTSAIRKKLKSLKSNCNQKYMEGNLDDFKNVSPIVQRKITEDFKNLSNTLVVSKYPISGVVAAIGRHDGRGMNSWNFEIFADGKINYSIEDRVKSVKPEVQKNIKYATPQKITELLMLYHQKFAGNSRNSLSPVQPGHDEDPEYIEIWSNGILQRNLLYSADQRTPLWSDFIKKFKLLFAEEMKTTN